MAIAQNQSKVIDALLKCNPNLNKQDKVLSVYHIVRCYYNNYRDLLLPYANHTFVQYGETALIIACKTDNLKVVKALLLQKADPNIANNVCVSTSSQDIENEYLKDSTVVMCSI